MFFILVAALFAEKTVHTMPLVMQFSAKTSFDSCHPSPMHACNKPEKRGKTTQCTRANLQGAYMRWNTFSCVDMSGAVTGNTTGGLL